MLTQSTFATGRGVVETFIAGTGEPGAESFAEELSGVLAELSRITRGKVLVWTRFHLSDPANQCAELRARIGGMTGMVSAVGQPPAADCRIAVETYCVDTGHLSGDGGCSVLDLANYRILFFRNDFCGERGSAGEMRREFEASAEVLRRFGGNVADNLQRTWIYCRDIDNNYAGLVTARKNFFDENGLTERTHYIASTGIEGISDPHERLVKMDCMALFGQQREQIEYLSAPEMLSPTQIYGVTFERGTRIVFGDRSHSYISGTASIDGNGAILHPGDVRRQAERMVRNVEALLRSRGGKLDDVRLAVVYLRDPADAKRVQSVLDRHLSPDTARIVLRGAVCRPGWLVEMECIAAHVGGDGRFASFSA